MDFFDEQTPAKGGVNKGHIIGGIIAVAVIAALIAVAMLRPSMEDQKAAVLQDAHREGSPEFDSITKDIIISTDDDTVESPTGIGRISMFIKGKIRNKGTRTINGLEVNVAVTTQFNEVLKEKRVLVVPTQQALLKPNEMIPITLSLDGFNKNDDRAGIRWKVTAIRVSSEQ